MPSQKICETLFRLVMCHLVGDYVLQIDFIIWHPCRSGCGESEV